MDLKLGLATVALPLARGDWVRVERARGAVIGCDEGELWVTQHNDLQDYILHAGQSFGIQNDGPVLAYAMQAGTLRVAPPVAADAPESWWNPFARRRANVAAALMPAPLR